MEDRKIKSLILGNLSNFLNGRLIPFLGTQVYPQTQMMIGTASSNFSTNGGYCWLPTRNECISLRFVVCHNPMGFRTKEPKGREITGTHGEFAIGFFFAMTMTTMMMIRSGTTQEDRILIPIVVSCGADDTHIVTPEIGIVPDIVLCPCTIVPRDWRVPRDCLLMDIPFLGNKHLEVNILDRCDFLTRLGTSTKAKEERQDEEKCCMDLHEGCGCFLGLFSW
mmetsp:Transcript_25079/g.58368  ORF Transcript_25079/g.58368 Transcript_25079/m.58368 type:complete len:222 (-) Transcript_25079:329-994(-)